MEYLKQKSKTSFADILSTCQLHISLTRTAQIYLELHCCVELHTKTSPVCLQEIVMLKNCVNKLPRKTQTAIQDSAAENCSRRNTCLTM